MELSLGSYPYSSAPFPPGTTVCVAAGTGQLVSARQSDHDPDSGHRVRSIPVGHSLSHAAQSVAAAENNRRVGTSQSGALRHPARPNDDGASGAAERGNSAPRANLDRADADSLDQRAADHYPAEPSGK